MYILNVLYVLSCLVGLDFISIAIIIIIDFIINAYYSRTLHLNIYIYINIYMYIYMDFISLLILPLSYI